MSVKAHQNICVDANVLESVRQSGANISEICENALRNFTSYTGNPDETKKNLENERLELEAALKDIAEKEKLAMGRTELHDKMAADLDVLNALNGWKIGAAKDSGLLNTIRRNFGVVPDLKTIAELRDEIALEGIWKCPDCGAEHLAGVKARTEAAKKVFRCARCQGSGVKL